MPSCYARTSVDGVPVTQSNEITSVAELEELFGVPLPQVAAKSRDVLHPIHAAWIARSPFLLLATSSTDGTCDVSPKGDPPGFVRVLDASTLAVPERPGNRRFDGWRNVVQNPHVGLLFLVPGRDDTLRVNGRARLVRDAPYFAEMAVRGRPPLLALELDVEQVFFHCAKAFLRSKLWDADRSAAAELPSTAQIAKELVWGADKTVAELEQYYGTHYTQHLY